MGRHRIYLRLAFAVYMALLPPAFAGKELDVCRELLLAKDETLAPLIAIKTSASRLTAADLGMGKEALIQAFREKPGYTWIFDDLMSERVTFAMNRAEKRREQIMERGFLNQFEAQQSDGTYDPILREEVEAAYSGMSVDDYRQVRAQERPKYGYLAPPLGGGVGRESSVQHYGTDIYLFKKENLRRRTTWVFGDSLDQSPQKEVRIPGTDNYRNSAKRISKSRRFLPWEDRGLMLPRLSEMEKGALPAELVVENWELDVTLPNGRRMKYGAEEVVQAYIELQFWKPLTLDDVETFIFAVNPPSGKFLEELRRRKIPIYRFDPKTRSDVLWTEK